MPRLASVRLTKRLLEELKPNTFLADSAMRGLAVKASGLGTRSFVITYRNAHGRQVRMKIGEFPADTVEQMRHKAQILLGGVKCGKDPSAERKAQRSIPTISELSDYYLGEYAKAQNLKPDTVKDARALLARARAKIGSKPVTAIAISDVRQLHSKVGEEVSRYQANRLVAVLSRLFSLSIEDGWVSTNPCKGIRRFPEDQRWRCLTQQEVTSLLTACDEYSDQNAANAIRLLLFTGARLQEVLKARWEQFDLERGIWEKPSAHTKTRRQHWLELPQPAIVMLLAMKASTNHAYLFPGRLKLDGHGEAIEASRGDIKRPWRWLVSKARLNNVRVHDLRRTTASFMLNEGASLATVGSALGHTQAATTARYARLSNSVQREGLAKAAQRMIANPISSTEVG